MLMALLLLQALTPVGPEVRPSSQLPDVVVSAKRLSGEDAVDRCLERQCPVPDAVAAALARSRRQFVDGDYNRARATLVEATARLRHESRAHPMPIASLWRARGNVEAHLGEYERYKSSLIEAGQVLRRGLGGDHPQRLSALIAVGDAEFHLGRPRYAEGFYRDALAAADRTGQPEIGAIARFRLANMIASRRPGSPRPADQREAAKMLAPLIGAKDPAIADFDLPARLFLARLADGRNGSNQVDAVLANLPGDVRTPLLLSSARVTLPVAEIVDCYAQDGYNTGVSLLGPSLSGGSGVFGACQNALNRKSTFDVERQWIDVRFRIEQNGAVREAEIARQSPQYKGGWAKHVLASVQSRRYAPMSPASAKLFGERIERFTLTAPLQTVTGERIRSRAVNPVIEREDLTPASAS